MTCKDCLHYEACKDTHDILDTACRGEFDYEGLERGCKNFTDPSEWVHIPCTDKKITDEEIIKALEYCLANRIECDKCALQRECESNPFYSTIAKYAFDLINRQKAEIERLKGSTIISNIMESQRIKREAKAEAYKEFAERLNEKAQIADCFDSYNMVVGTHFIDNLLKEMVGEEK